MGEWEEWVRDREVKYSSTVQEGFRFKLATSRREMTFVEFSGALGFHHSTPFVRASAWRDSDLPSPRVPASQLLHTRSSRWGKRRDLKALRLVCGTQ